MLTLLGAISAKYRNNQDCVLLNLYYILRTTFLFYTLSPNVTNKKAYIDSLFEVHFRYPLAIALI